ncbi:MAG: glycosyltransferase family 2 protein [Gemmatimonadota bacterium]
MTRWRNDRTDTQRESELRVLQTATVVIVPAYSESAVIGSVVAGLRALGWSVLVVDDGSPDRTTDAAAEAGAVVLRHPVNLGQGAALRTGFAHALRRPDFRFVVTFDADGQHAPEAVETLLHPLARGDADVVLGSRFLDPAFSIAVPPLRRVLLRMATLVSRRTTGLSLTDSHNGLRAFTAEAVSVLHLEQDRMAHASEIQAEIARNRLRCVECAVHVRYTPYSIAKGQRLVDAVSILWDLLLTNRRPRV